MPTDPGLPPPDPRRSLETAFPVLLERHMSSGRMRDALLTTDYLTGFHVGYSLREEMTKPVPLTRRLAESMGLSAETVHKAALQNLAKDCASATFKFFDSEEGGVLLFEGEGQFHSSRLLMRGVYGWLHKFMRGPFVVAVPNRDVMIAVAESNRAMVDGLPADLEASYRAKRYPLTLRQFRVTQDGVMLIS